MLGDWVRAVADVRGIAEADAREGCARELDALLDRLSAGDVEGVRGGGGAAGGARGRGAARASSASPSTSGCSTAASPPCSPPPARTASRSPRPWSPSTSSGDRRLEALLAAQEDESARRLVEAQEQAARAAERAREVQRANEALRRAEAESRHRAEQIGLLSSVAHRIAAIREPEELMQQAADQIRARMNHTYVAVVVLDDEGVLVGRWAGRPGLGRTSAGRAQGPPGGVIGRALRLRAPQVVGDVDARPGLPPRRARVRARRW